MFSHRSIRIILRNLQIKDIEISFFISFLIFINIYFIGDIVKDNVAIFFIKLLLSILITLIILIIMKANSKFKTTFYKKVYDTNISFNYFNDIYNKYIGNFDFLGNINSTELVFNEKLVYKNKERYEDGVRVEIDNSLVPINESGIVVYIGD